MTDAFAGTKNTLHTAAGKNVLNGQIKTASFTVDPDQVGFFTRLTHATVAIAVTLPRDSAANIPVYSQFHYDRGGAAAASFAAGSGATLNLPSGKSASLSLNGRATLTKVAADTWELSGDLLPGEAANNTAAATAGAATLNKTTGKITSEALTTAQDAAYTLTLTDDQIAATDIVLASVANGTNTQGTTVVTKVTPAAGSVVIIIHNKHATAQALNGTIVVSFVVIKQT